MPSLREVEIRTKDLERWYKNGCKLPDVLYESSTSSPTVVESVSLPALVSPARPAHRSFAHREITTDRQNGSNVRSSLVSKKQPHTNKTLQHGNPKLVGSGRDFDASKSLICRLRPEFLCEVCDIKHSPAALRQLLQATCCALGKLLPPKHTIDFFTASLTHLQASPLMQLPALNAYQITALCIACLTFNPRRWTPKTQMHLWATWQLSRR